MSTWILHIVGETIDDDLAAPVEKFVKEIQSLSHRVKQVRITTDTGERVIHIAQDVEKVVDEVDPALAPEASAVEADVEKEVDKHETPATAAPIQSATPAADPTAQPVDATTPPEDTPVDPPVAGASSTDSTPSSTTTAIPAN
jgi:hypothetical protein